MLSGDRNVSRNTTTCISKEYCTVLLLVSDKSEKTLFLWILLEDGFYLINKFKKYTNAECNVL